MRQLPSAFCWGIQYVISLRQRCLVFGHLVLGSSGWQRLLRNLKSHGWQRQVWGGMQTTKSAYTEDEPCKGEGWSALVWCCLGCDTRRTLQTPSLVPETSQQLGRWRRVRRVKCQNRLMWVSNQSTEGVCLGLFFGVFVFLLLFLSLETLKHLTWW